MFESLLREQEHCPDTMCAFLPLGFVLMSADAYHDLQWCFAPSPKTEQALRNYYTNLLTPTLKMGIVLWPGYLFPLYAIYVFLWQCPNMYNWYTFILYMPVAWRYFLILTGRDRRLAHWWTIPVIRIALTTVTIWNLQSRDCGSPWK